MTEDATSYKYEQDKTFKKSVSDVVTFVFDKIRKRKEIYDNYSQKKQTEQNKTNKAKNIK